MAVEAAVKGYPLLLKQAMMMDPLVGAVCSTPEIWRMTDEMLAAQARWLPQYREAVREARKNLKKAGGPAGRGTEGAARLKTRTVEEMERDRRAARTMAAAADKGRLMKKRKV